MKLWKIIAVLALVAAAVAIYARLSFYHRGGLPPWENVEHAQMLLHDARRRDPFACEHGLHGLLGADAPPALKVEYVKACCHPPVSSTMGWIVRDCGTLDRESQEQGRR